MVSGCRRSAEGKLQAVIAQAGPALWQECASDYRSQVPLRAWRKTTPIHGP
jgi:hypothetical protein